MIFDRSQLRPAGLSGLGATPEQWRNLCNRNGALRACDTARARGMTVNPPAGSPAAIAYARSGGMPATAPATSAVPAPSASQSPSTAAAAGAADALAESERRRIRAGQQAAKRTQELRAEQARVAELQRQLDEQTAAAAKAGEDLKAETAKRIRVRDQAVKNRQRFEAAQREIDESQSIIAQIGVDRIATDGAPAPSIIPSLDPSPVVSLSPSSAVTAASGSSFKLSPVVLVGAAAVLFLLLRKGGKR